MPAQPGAVLAPTSHWFIYCCQRLAQDSCVSGEFFTLWTEISPDLKMCNSSVSPHLCLNMPHTCVCQLSAKMGKKGFIRYRAREHLDLETGPEG